MNALAIKPFGKQPLTDAEKESLIQAYHAPIFPRGSLLTVHYCREAVKTIQAASTLRMKSYGSTRRWDAMADFTGMISEWAAQRACGIPAEAAIQSFLSGLQGDRGYDLEANGLKIDVKGTRSPALRMKFSTTNKFSHVADAYLFAYAEEVGTQWWVHLLGWADKVAIKPYMRNDGRRLFVRVETLRRESVLKPVNLLKAMIKAEGVASHG